MNLSIRFFFLLLTLAALAATSATAQDRIDAQVTYIAGDNAYLDVGTEAGLAAGDTLTAYRDDRRLGTLRVVSATADRAVVAFAGAPFAITLGDRLQLEGASSPEPEPDTSAPTPMTPPVTERPSILDQPAAGNAANTPSYRTPTVSGRFQTGISVLSSSTQPTADGPSETRTFSLPFAAFRAGVENLPGGLRLDANLRATFRSSQGFTFDEPADVRVYQLSAEKGFASLPLAIRAGRFYNEYDRFSGYWDGLQFHVGDERRGVGVAAGFQPSRADEAPSGDLPKYTVFGHNTSQFDGARLESTLLAGQVLPQTAGMQTRTFVGTEQSVRGRGFSLSADALADQEPETGSWTLSRLSGRASFTASRGVRLSAYALSRRPYLLLGDFQELLDRSTRIGGGATFTLREGPMPGTSLRLDVSNATTEARPDTRSFSGGLSVPRLPVAQLGFSANATVWTQDGADGTARQGIYGGAGFSRTVGTLFARLGYRYQQSPLGPDDALVTHGLDALLQVPISRRLAFTLQADTQFGDRLSTTRLYSALWVRL